MGIILSLKGKGSHAHIASGHIIVEVESGSDVGTVVLQSATPAERMESERESGIRRTLYVSKLHM